MPCQNFQQVFAYPRPPPGTLAAQTSNTAVTAPGGCSEAEEIMIMPPSILNKSLSQYPAVSILHSGSPSASFVLWGCKLARPDHHSGEELNNYKNFRISIALWEAAIGWRSSFQSEVRVGTNSRVGLGKMGEKDLKFVELSDGRRIAYREQGLGKEMATRSLLVLHGLGSSRLAGMPGVSESLLKEMGVRLVSIDRPGYGESDFNTKQTFETAAKDVAQVADLLELGQKIWLLGYSCGGAYCWAAARYIPERIAGIATWAPVGNYYWKGISESERITLMGSITARSRSIYGVLGKLPHWLLYAYVRFFVVPSVGSKWVEDAKKRLSPPDVQNLQGISGHLMERDSTESGKQKGKGIAQDLLLISSAWGFELSDVQDAYQGSFHIFQGDQDNLVPVGLQLCIKKVVPDLVHLHALKGEGHLSAFCYNDKIHRETLECLFGGAETVGEIGKADKLDLKVEGHDDNTYTDTLQPSASALDAPYIH